MLDDIPLHGMGSNPARIVPPKPGVTAIGDLNLGDELAIQLRDAKYLNTQVLDDESTAANQKAQVLNTIGTVIKNIIDMQERLHNVEVMKAIEQALIDTLKEFPDVQAKFLEVYGQKLGTK